MERLCAYDSSSSSDDDEESPKNKKRKANSTKIDRGNGRASGPNIGQPKDKLSLLNPSFEPSNATGTLVGTISVSNAIPSFSALNYHSGLSNRLGGVGDDHKTHSQGVGNQTKKTLPVIGSVTRKTHTKTSTSRLSVKPYVSKREREKIAQENALITASTFSTNHRLEDIDRDHSLKGVELKSELKTDISSNKTTRTDLVCRPPKKLHLNLEGHSQGVNCVRWNPVESNLLMSASMDHVVCVWDTHKGGVCSQRLTRHSEAVKDSKWSMCGSQVLTCGYDKTARLFNLETGSDSGSDIMYGFRKQS